MEISFHRLFSMPAIEGLRTIRIYFLKSPDKKIEEIVLLIMNVEADANSFDLEASAALHCIVSEGIVLTGTEYYQRCIHDLILYRQPGWVKLMGLGRTRFAKKLTQDERSLFRHSGLLDTPLPENIRKWWDDLTGRVRFLHDAAKMEQAREAEKNTLEHERSRLQKIGITEEPVWTAIEDNTAGYDVQSYKKNAYGLVNKLIEVKSTIASPLRFFVTRNEWEQALKFGDAYCFHIWDMKHTPPILHERLVVDVAPHIPEDNAKGKWKNAEIPVNI